MTRTEKNLHRRLLKLELQSKGTKLRGKKNDSKKRAELIKQLTKSRNPISTPLNINRNEKQVKPTT